MVRAKSVFTFRGIGSFLEALALQNVTQIVCGYVSIQDFTSASDIDWSKSIPEIDCQLYAKYGLSEDEIAFIEEKIKPME